MQIALVTTFAASLSALSAPELFATLKSARDGRDALRDAAESADVRFGIILSAIEDTRKDGTLAKYVKANTGIDSRDIGHGYKWCVVFRALVKPGIMPEAVYSRALPSWVVPASAVCNALTEDAHKSKAPAMLAELAALFTAGKAGDDTTAKIVALKESLLGVPEKKPTAAEKAVAEVEAKLKAAEEKVAAQDATIKQAEENGRIHMRQMAEAQENGRRLVEMVKAVREIASAALSDTGTAGVTNCDPLIAALPASETRDVLAALLATRVGELAESIHFTQTSAKSGMKPTKAAKPARKVAAPALMEQAA
jgi:hypothetical protein